MIELPDNPIWVLFKHKCHADLYNANCKVLNHNREQGIDDDDMEHIFIYNDRLIAKYAVFYRSCLYRGINVEPYLKNLRS